MANTYYSEIFKGILNEVDPIGLIDLETPQSLDEYAPEISEIIKKDISKLNPQELSQWVYDVFKNFFSEKIAGDKKKYDLIANKFLAVVNKKQ